ncbi:head-tail adaptor protein [Roseibium hamelinense]|uniref:head-tail adaptor protein n=1 Tax=Roseibium hamelinense TaxID=150831 RepID=UPI001479144D|nr:head-tail adaptor protein [Roseibium hamelinense]
MPVVLLRPVHSVEADGTASLTYAEAGADFAAVALKSQGEAPVAGHLDGVATHDIRLRYRAGLKGGWKLVSGTRIFRLLSVNDPDGRYRELRCAAEEEAT